MSTSLKIAAAALLALFASSFAASPAQAQHRTNRWTGIVRDVVDVIADEIEDYEDDYADDYADDYEDEYDDEEGYEDEYEDLDYQENYEEDGIFGQPSRRSGESWMRGGKKRIPAELVGAWSVTTGNERLGVRRYRFVFSSSGAATQTLLGNFPNARIAPVSLGNVTWNNGALTLAGVRYTARFRGSQLLLTDIRGNVTKLTRVE